MICSAITLYSYWRHTASTIIDNISCRKSSNLVGLIKKYISPSLQIILIFLQHIIGNITAASTPSWCNVLLERCSQSVKIMFEYRKSCLKRSLKKKTKLVFKTVYRLIQVKSIAECSKGSILQYFRPSLKYHLSLISFFVYFWVAA